MTEKERSWCKMKWFQEALQHEHRKRERTRFAMDVSLPRQIASIQEELFENDQCVFCSIACMEGSLRGWVACRACILASHVFDYEKMGCEYGGRRMYQELEKMGEGEQNETIQRY